MANELQTLNIQDRILTIRNKQVMIDRDIAELYDVETKALNQAVKRNLERFPEEFCFQLISNEKNELVTNCDRFNMLKHSSSNPYAFTEQGVAMLSAVLKSETAVQVSIQIMNAFVSMRHFLQSNSEIFAEIKSIRKHIRESDIHQNESDKKIEQLFDYRQLGFISYRCISKRPWPKMLCIRNSGFILNSCNSKKYIGASNK